jgi:diaminopimelate decarboxylase
MKMSKPHNSISKQIDPFSGIDLLDIACRFETPFYLYDIPFAVDRIRQTKSALGKDILLYYAIKANPNTRLLMALAEAADGADISSGGELHKALQAGFKTENISFAGPGKSDREIDQAISDQIGSISIESLHELQRVEKAASDRNKKVQICLRINPIKIFKEFAIKMGGRPSQFGIDEEQAESFFVALENCPHCDYKGIHIYSGTQCLKSDILLENFRNTMDVVEKLYKKFGRKPFIINFGGGFGVPYYDNQNAIDGNGVCTSLSELFSDFKLRNQFSHTKGILELGRYLIAEAGVYITRIIDVKTSRGRNYCITDGGMHHHLPASGNFGQVIRKNFKMKNLSNPDWVPEKISVAGPLCTSIDILGDNVSLPKPRIGDYLAILNSGAYAFTASPLQFLSHPTPAELALDDEGNIHTFRDSYLPD